MSSNKFFVLGIDDEGQWLKPTATNDDKKYFFQSEYAKSGRARCRVCSEPIPKGTVRLGKALK
jgi:hypothetical protein